MHHDILGRELSVGDFVTNDHRVYRIEKFTAKMVTVTPACSGTPGIIMNGKYKPIHKYSSELTLVPEQDVMLWMLKKK